MKLLDGVAIAVKSLLANKMRSALTMLGIIIGVGSVITLMSVGRGAQNYITAAFQQMGTNILYVMARSPDVGGLAGFSPVYTVPTLTLEDSRSLERIPSVLSADPENENFVEVIFGRESKTAVIHGATPGYQTIYNHTMASGQFIADRHVTSRDMVVVLGSQVAKDLFGTSDPVGQIVKIKDHRFTVIGVLKPKGGSLMGMSLDDVIVTPITTFQARLFATRTATGEDAVQSIAVKVASDEAMDRVQEEIESTLRRRHRLSANEKDDFAVFRQDQIAGIFNQIMGVFTIFLGAIASVSLLVGSIGIMNIMLVSVTERTREIGIRKAVGAKRRDILLQFLIEAATLSLGGGAIGLMGGSLIAFLVSRIDVGGVSLHATVTPDIVILAISVSVLIGLASGIYPAMRAARKDPIDALRYG